MSNHGNLKLIDAPRHIVTAYQIQEEEHSTNDDEDSSSIPSNITKTTKKTYPIGSLFTFAMQSALSSSLLASSSLLPRCRNENEEDDDDNDYDDEEEDEISRNPLTIEIPPSTKLTIDTVSVDPLSFSRTPKDSTMSLHISTDVNDFSCLCPYLSSHYNKNHHCQSMVQNLNISIIGPNTIQLALIQNGQKNDKSIDVNSTHVYANIFGKVEVVDEDIANAVVDAKTNHVFDELKRLQSFEEALDKENHELIKGKKMCDSKIDHGEIINKDIIIIGEDGSRQVGDKRKEEEPIMHEVVKDNIEVAKDNIGESQSHPANTMVNSNVDKKEKEGTLDKKRKLSELNNISKVNTEPSTDVPEIQKLTKKQRKKLAKKKRKELEEAVAKTQGHNTSNGKPTNASSTTTNNQPRKVSLTKQRALSCGVLIQDIVHGTGATVRAGRKLSINYVGKFADIDKEFDKNTSSSHPFVFRVGTGEVIKGLDTGMEGMKVGGERIITIPPKLGYGNKGSGKIPGNSTLCFEVKLLAVG